MNRIIAAPAAAGLLAVVQLVSHLSAQTPSSLPPNTFQRLTTSTAPKAPTEVHPDGTVTFRLIAPDAMRVDVAMEPGSRHPMTKGSDGIWTLTAGPFTPEIYRYQFVVDGVSVTDPSNPIVSVGRFRHQSVLDIPGSPARFDEWRDVPHGAVHDVEYYSRVLKIRRHVNIYVPPQYESERTRRFPVLYLRHGNGDMESTWINTGHAGIILENLLAQRKAEPMLIVMPNGYPAHGEGTTPEGTEETARELMTDIIPLVERTYRVVADADHRAIAGLSMGAGQAFLTGLRHTDTFAYVGVFSSGVISVADFDLRAAVPELMAKNAKQPRLLFLSCGTEDPRYPGYLQLMANLKANGVRYEWFSTPGAHEWKVWGRSLAEMAPKLFKPTGVQPPNS
jgi:enterochelin esterase family protein